METTDIPPPTKKKREGERKQLLESRLIQENTEKRGLMETREIQEKTEK